MGERQKTLSPIFYLYFLRMEGLLREIPISDQLFYWGRGGRSTTVLELLCTMKDTVEPEALKKALIAALGIHTNFRQQPVVVNGAIKAVLLSPDVVKVYPASDGPKRLGTSDTGGLMVYASYEGHSIKMHVFHGIADLRGIYGFMQTLLVEYLRVMGRAECKEYVAKCTDTASVFEDLFSREIPATSDDGADSKRKRVFHLPERGSVKGKNAQHQYEIDLPLEPLLSLARASHSTVVPTLQAIFGQAISSLYGVRGNESIICYTPVDLRPVFDVESGGNASSAFAIPYESTLYGVGLSDAAAHLRTILLKQIQPGNAIKVVARLSKIVDILKKLPIRPETATVIARKIGSGGDRRAYTYGFSYPGKFQIPEEAVPYVDSVSASAKSHSFPVWVMGCEFGGTIRLVFTQAFDSDRLVRAIHDELQKVFPDTEFKDNGSHSFDEFFISEVPHLKS